jgi:integrase
MSVTKRNSGWQVKWRADGRQRSRSFTRKGDATRFDAEVKRRAQLGPALVRELTRDTETLDGFIRGPWAAHAATLAPKTRERYAWGLEGHLAELVHEPLQELDVTRLTAHQRLLIDRGASAYTVRAAMSMLGAILQVAVEHGRLPANPARAVRKPRDPRSPIDPLGAVELERVIAALDGRDRAIALLGGHLGLRPIEIRLAPWSALRGEHLIVGADTTKATAARTRTVKVPRVTMQALREWRLQSRHSQDHDAIVGPMSANAIRLWGSKAFRVVVADVTAGRIPKASTYLLRHSHASALHYAGFTPAEAANRLGHGVGLHWQHYAHVVESMSGTRYGSLDALIVTARADLMFPSCSPSSMRGL